MPVKITRSGETELTTKFLVSSEATLETVSSHILYDSWIADAETPRVVFSVLSSLPTLGEIMKVGGHIGERELIMGVWGRAPARSRGRAPGGVWGGEAPWSWKPCSLRSSHGNGKIDPFSLFCKLNTHRPTMHIWCVLKNNYGYVWSSNNVKCTVLSQSTKSIW